MEPQQPHGSTEPPITRQSTATSKRSGKQCRKHAMGGRTVCLAHGGKSPRGTASPHFKTGRYSRSLPGHLVATYERALNDPKLLSLRDDLALTDAMIAELLGQLDEDSSERKYQRVFGQISRLIERRRRLVETEVRHIVLAREMLTMEEALTLLESIVAIVERYVPNRNDRQAVSEELHALISNGPEITLGAHDFAGASN